MVLDLFNLVVECNSCVQSHDSGSSRQHFDTGDERPAEQIGVWVGRRGKHLEDLRPEHHSLDFPSGGRDEPMEFV